MVRVVFEQEQVVLADEGEDCLAAFERCRRSGRVRASRAACVGLSVSDESLPSMTIAYMVYRSFGNRLPGYLVLKLASVSSSLAGSRPCVSTGTSAGMRRGCQNLPGRTGVTGELRTDEVDLVTVEKAESSAA